MHPTIDELGTLLGVWAHPDDEAYLCAGLMAAARDQGHRVVAVTATLGEHGTADPVRWPPERLGPVRAAELAASLHVLGVDEHRVLGYRDGACAAAPPEGAVAQLVSIIGEVQPDTILTFGPDGLTGHPDHRAVGRWATEAWQASGRGARLLHAATTESFATRFADLHRQFDVYEPGLPVVTPDDEVAMLVRLEGAALARKVEALRAHATQTAGLVATIGLERYATWCAEEAFVENS
jgi:LmbE family N-acetylglucosaminyl deacetylase